MQAARTALISDIHGNLVALEAVVADLRHRGIERIICLGDVAATGPQPAACISLVAELGCSVVMGNTDEWLLDPHGEPGEDEDSRRIHELELWGAAQLAEEHRTELAGYRPLVELDGLLCYHGSPRSNTEEIRDETAAVVLDGMLEGHRARVFAGGHTHVAMLRRHHAAVVINPGSVGLPVELTEAGGYRNPPIAEYAVVRGENIEFVRVPLDVGAVVDAARRSGMPHATWWVKDWAWG